MDPKLIKIIEEMINEGFARGTLIAACVFVIAGIASAFLSSYLVRKGKNFASKEDFQSLLDQIKTQTEITESIKADLQKEITIFSESLTQEYENRIFRRTRIIGHLDEILKGSINLSAVAQKICLRSWVLTQTDLQAEEEFYTSLFQIRYHFGSLEFFNAIPASISKEYHNAEYKLIEAWQKTTGEASLRLPKIAGESPRHKEFSEGEYNALWIELMSKVGTLGNLVKGLSGKVLLNTSESNTQNK